jgi:hypothetical protein
MVKPRIALLLILAIFTRKECKIRREIVVNVSRQKIFEYLKQLKNQDNFKKWEMADTQNPAFGNSSIFSLPQKKFCVVK